KKITEKKDCVREIISLRNRLMAFKRYYEQLLNIFDDLQENENEIVQKSSLRYLKIFSGRIERLYHTVLNLRDYVTQVREAYQAEVDISLNKIMKIFTVITAIFLPLTLIAGWYGMNLQMPEFGWPFGYPMVIILSVAVVVFCILYFKKNKWF
ncbi:MAG: CorA family divalent cation transporter, partial [Christensenellales bacterium]